MTQPNMPPPAPESASLLITRNAPRARNRWLPLLVIVGALLLIGFYVTSDATALAHDHALGALDFLGGAVCHRLTGHSIIIAGRQMPLCARCSGIYLGVLLTFLVTLLAGRERDAALPRLPVLLALLGLVGVMGVDGLNSYSHFLPRAPHLYQPQNWLRLATGLGAGLAMGSIVSPALAQTLWQSPRWQPPLRSLRELGGLALLAGVVGLLALSNQPTLLYVLALASGAGLLAVLSAINSMLLLMGLRREGRYVSWRQALPALTFGLALALLELMAGAWLRLSLFGTLTGLPGLS
ncbi:MAG: DUF2085 domain-containing protein [Anaerolineales bacterium]|nr:DUF2085 domain-containing protein [Anaerolineales bacterium]MCB8951187.1 DUF2085 domain-containing protein [Ardenticatenales bacterium]